jgi:N-acetyl-anhydromuramoyl-L-alanine amidase
LVSRTISIQRAESQLPIRPRISERGVIEGVRNVPSPNCDARPAGSAIDLLVIHYISLPPGEFGGPGIIEHFTNRLDPRAHPFYDSIAGAKVSAHFLVRRDGKLIQFVPCAKRAWHAGESSWKGRTRCNDFSIGIEMEGTEKVPFTAAQYRRLAVLTRVLQARYPIRDIAGHSDVAPGRKTDPGPYFDWARYRALLITKAEPQRTRRTPRKDRNRTVKNATAAKKTITRLRTARTPARHRKSTKN